jgi:hypothetical protein
MTAERDIARVQILHGNRLLDVAFHGERAHNLALSGTA